MRDNAVIGRRAAEYFLSHGLRNFAFIGRKGYREDVAGVIREQAFRERLKKDFGGNVSYSSRFIGSFGNNENFWEADQVETEEWIKSLPTPCEPVYLVTADVEARDQLERNGFTGVLLKPVTLDGLRTALQG